MTNQPQIEPPGGDQPKSRHWIWVVLVLLVVAGAIVYQMSRTRTAAKDVSADQPISVGVAPVIETNVPFYLTGLGTVTAYNTVTVHSRVDGQIMKVYFREGQFVKTGALLAEIDPRPYQVALEQAQGQLAKDQATQKDAMVDLNRYHELWKDGVVSRQQLDTQQAQVGQYDGSIESDQAQIASAKLNLSYCRITSPIDGRVGLRLVDPGNIVHATDTNGMLVITQVNPIAVDFTLPEDQLPQVMAEMRGRQLTVEAYGRDNNVKLGTGKLLTIDNQIDPTTGTIKLKSEFSNPKLSLWPNQFVNVRLLLSERKNAIVVPSAAVQKGTQDTTFVYLVGSNHKADVQPVQVDFTQGNSSVIRQGLKAGEDVVVDGGDKLQPGAVVVTHSSNPIGGTNSSSGGNADSGLHP
ncbi:MAG: MdtA/MuxA family multidrug efflux RND transporter periplasmic adaptor subunit [Candidatus Acidiferrales bacterium]